MRYLVITDENEPMLTNWFEVDNHFNHEVNMMVIDLALKKYMVDGKIWNDIVEDHL